MPVSSHPKRKLAQKLLGGKALPKHKIIFDDNPAWMSRKERIARQVEKRVNRAVTRRKEREEAKKRGEPVVYSIK